MKQFDGPRNAMADASFARSMSSGMRQYEAAIAPTKRKLFGSLLSTLPTEGAVVVELGLGTFPNAPYYAELLPSRCRGVEIVGVDPNDSMGQFARSSADAAGLTARGDSVRIVHGVGEALPFARGSVDALVCTLTLCSVVDPARVLEEITRVLKPDTGRFLFVEHVLSEADAVLAAQQRAATPLQAIAADGCHLDRRTLRTIQQTAGLELAQSNGGADTYFELPGFYVLSPTIAGIAKRVGV
jgi:SAM-dependent methyltransferase